MSSFAVAAPAGCTEADLDSIWDEELLKNMWQTAEDSGERRRIRARMYRLRELRLREMVQNDEESLGALAPAEGDEDEASVGDYSPAPSRSAESKATVTSTAVESRSASSENTAEMTKRTRSQQIKDKLNTESDSEALLSITKTGGYSVQNDALSMDASYASIKEKETRDSESPSRLRTQADAEIDSEEERALAAETENVIKALQKAGKTVKVIKSEIPVRREVRGRVETQSPSPKKGSPTRTKTTKKTITSLDSPHTQEFDKLSSYLKSDSESNRIVIDEDEEEMLDEFGNKVQMFVTTTKDKDGKEFITRRTAQTTKVVENVDDIDEILIGNPDHEVLERDVNEEEAADGSRIKVITETRRRPDGVEYTTKNILKTSKIFDYDHPEDVHHCESDHLVSTAESEETDEHGVTIRTVTETRRKRDGTDYTTKKVYKTSKLSSRITPSDTDEIIDSKETEEKDEDGNVTRTVIETRRTADGEEYTHRQVFKCRRMTLTGVELQKGVPMMDNDDEVLNKKEKKEKDENGADITVVTETRRRKDGTTYTFDYILRNFQGSRSRVKDMPTRAAGATNIQVSEDDELIKEEVKEEEQNDGTIVKTVIERRRAKDGTEYLRHRIMRIPKITEPELTVGTASDEVLENDVEEREYNGTRIKSVTERRRSSLTGIQYTLRRMSKSYQKTRRPSTAPGDEVLDENVTEEEADDGTIVKTVIRRYQRKDGTIYTTHNVNKSFSAPTQVTTDDDNDGELIDQTMDQKETEDGFIIKTVTETYQRADGLQYTIERTEKSDKNSASVLYTKDYPNQPVELIVPNRGDVILSQEVEELPDDEGQITKTITEERMRANGTRYVSKTTMTIMPVLVPEQETSYVIIKPEEGVDDNDLLPSIDDEVVYTRTRQEKDGEGNLVEVVIETRKSRTTGEMYNITKRVFSTDVMMTDKGEKVIKRKPLAMKETSKTPKTSPDKLAPTGTVSSMKDKLTSKGTKSPVKEKEKPRLIRVNTADRRKLFENAPDVSASRPSPRRETNGRPADFPRGGTAPDRSGSKPLGSKPGERPSTRPEEPKKPVTEKKLQPSRKSPNDTAPAQSPTKKPLSHTRASPKDSPDSNGRTPTKTVRSPISRPSPRSSRDPSPAGGRSCCNRAHGGQKPKEEVPSPSKRPLNKSSPKDKETPKLNGDVRNSRESPRETTRSRPSNIFETPKRSSPSKSSPEKFAPGEDTTEPKEPIVSLPQTPMTEEMKTYPAVAPKDDEPIIEDVSEDPNLPLHKIHRPSIVREPSEYLGPETLSKVPETGESPKKPDSDDRKKTAKPYTRKNSANLMDRTSPPLPETLSKEPSKLDKPGRDAPTSREPVSSRRPLFDRDNLTDSKEPKLTSRKQPENYAPKSSPTYEGREPVKEPLIVPRYFHPLGESAIENDKRPLLNAPADMASPKLIMRLTSAERDQPKGRPLRDDGEPALRPATETNGHFDTRRSESRESSPTPDKKTSFSKEGSPSRFVTGRPIDQGVNANKIKKLERSLSGKVTYEDLEDKRNHLPSYLETIETIFDVTVLETMLEKAESYEERRVIRGQIRTAKKQRPQPAPVPTSSSHRFTAPSSRPSTASPDTRSPAARQPEKGRATPSGDTWRQAPSRTSPTREAPSQKPQQPRSSRPEDAPESPNGTPRAAPTRKTSDQPSAPAQRRPSRGETSPDRGSNEQPRNPKAPSDVSKRPLNSQKSSDRLTNGAPKSSPARRPSHEEIRTTRTTKTSLFARKDSREIKVAKTIELSETKDQDTTKSTSRYSRRGSEEKRKPLFPRRDSGDKKTLLSRRDSNEKTTPHRKDSEETKPSRSTTTPSKTPGKTPTSRPSSDRPSSKQPSKPDTSTFYSEPLRHQQTTSAQRSTLKQTDVEKIVSPYGVGPTDENGMPLFGLRALKKKNQQTAPADAPAPEEIKPKEFEPTDASGRPLFGLKALKGTSTTTATTTTSSTRKSSASSVTRKTSRTDDDDDYTTKRRPSTSSPDQSDHEDAEGPHDVDDDVDASRRVEETEEDSIIHRTRPLKDIIKLHETIVKEPSQPQDDTPRSKPRKLLRDFEPSPDATEDRTTHKTWDVQSDLATRAVDIKNVISRHESIGKEIEEDHKPAKKPQGILKKTSTSSASDAQYAASSSISTTTVDTSEFMDHMSEDQIAKLSEEFDRRTKEDGQINGGDSVRRGDRSPDRPSDLKRKTSYSEIKLSQPSKGESSQRATTTVRSSYTREGGAACNGEDAGVRLTTNSRSFLQDRSKVSGFGDVMGRMAATNSGDDGAVTSDDQARSLLNRFLGAQVLLTGVESMMASPGGAGPGKLSESSTTTSSQMTRSSKSSSSKISGAEVVLVNGVDINSEQDEQTLRKLLDSCDAYEDRRKLRQRLKALSADAAGGVSGRGAAAGGASLGGSWNSSGSGGGGVHSAEDAAVVNSWLSDNFPDHSSSTTTITTTKTGPRASQASSYSSYSQSSKVTKAVSPFNKFQQLDAQQHTTRRASGSGAAGAGGPLFALSSSLKSSANSIKDVLLQWCQCRTRGYEGVKIENFSTSWNDGMAFCALIHHFYPDAFDFDKLDPKNRRYNFDLAFRTADDRAGVMALLDVEDMVMMKKPDWKCVFTYIQSLYKRLKDE